MKKNKKKGKQKLNPNKVYVTEAFIKKREAEINEQHDGDIRKMFDCSMINAEYINRTVTYLALKNLFNFNYEQYEQIELERKSIHMKILDLTGEYKDYTFGSCAKELESVGLEFDAKEEWKDVFYELGLKEKEGKIIEALLEMEIYD